MKKAKKIFVIKMMLDDHNAHLYEKTFILYLKQYDFILIVSIDNYREIHSYIVDKIHAY